jgi:type II secretory pathway pseudopilin PulG
MDWVLIAAVLALALIGTLLVWSATRTGLAQAGGNPDTYLERQLLNVAIGLVLLIAVSLINYRVLRMYTPLVYAAACLGLLVVLSPLGATVNGAHSWIALPGGFQIEPSEFAKIGMILMLAVVLGDLRDRATRPGALEVALALACGGLPLLLVILQPDLGVTILLLVLLVGMIAVSGVRLRWLAGLGMAGVLAALAVAGYRKYVTAAGTSEAMAMVQLIRHAETTHKLGEDAQLTYLGCSGCGAAGCAPGAGSLTAYYPMATPSSKKYTWEQAGHPDYQCWRLLNVRTDGAVRFGYAVVAGGPGDAVVSPVGFAHLPALQQPNDHWFVI